VTDLAAFPDVEQALVAVLGDLAAEVGTTSPPDPGAKLDWLPLIRVNVRGGVDNLITDRSRVDVECFAATRIEAKELGEAVRQRLLGKPHTGSGWVLDRVTTDAKPAIVAYVAKPPPWRSVAAYTVSARRPVGAPDES
jgi:hypothetical protein